MILNALIGSERINSVPRGSSEFLQAQDAPDTLRLYNIKTRGLSDCKSLRPEYSDIVIPQYADAMLLSDSKLLII